MSTFLIAFLVALGGGAWIYNKVQRRTGGLTQTSLLMAGVASVVLFLFILMLFSFLPD